MMLQELRRRFIRYDLEDIFHILQFLSTVDLDIIISSLLPIAALPKKFNLLDQWDDISEEAIKGHVKFLRLYGREYDLQHLDWSLEMLESSCKSPLQIGCKNN